MVNFNFSLHKATHIEHRHFWLPVATAGRGFCRGKRTATQAANDGTVVVSRPCGMPKQTVTTRVKSTKLTDQHRWVEILFRFLPAVFLPVVRWPACFVEFFCLLALDCIVPWEFEILYRAELSNPARNCHIFPGFSSFDFWPAVGCGPCSGRCFLRFSVLGASFGVEDDYSRFSALPSIFYVCFVYLFPRIFGSIRLYRAVWYSQLGPWFCWWQFISGRPLWSTCCDLTDQNIKGFSNHIILS